MDNLGQKYNERCPGVKRLLREAMELAEATEEYCARPLEDNLFEWHFTVAGPEGTEFEGGVYHGRIILPQDYPMKPPDIVLLTPNGRFEINKKICLSISGYHPETWRPSWSIRTALLALIAFMPSAGEGTIGALDYAPAERRALARKSRSWTCNECGPAPALLSGCAARPPSAEERTMLGRMALEGEGEAPEEPAAPPSPDTNDAVAQVASPSPPSPIVVSKQERIGRSILIGALVVLIVISIYRRWQQLEAIFYEYS